MTEEDVHVPPVERNLVPEPVERTSRDRERRREQRKQKQKREPEPEESHEEGKGENVDIRA